MTYFHPAWLEHQRKRFARADAYRFAAPGTPEAKPPGWLDPSMTRVRLKEAQEAEARATFETQLAELRASHERAREELAEINYALVLRRLCRKYGYNPHQPRDDHGRWTSGVNAVGNAAVGHTNDSGEDTQTANAGENGEDSRVRLAGDPPLQRIHPDSTYETDPEARRSLDHWRKQPTDRIVESLKPGNEEALRAYPDGRVANGNTRLKILQERGYDINSLLREIHRGGGRPRSLWPWQ